MGISLFTGCSYTSGTGFTYTEKETPGLWVNLLHKKNEFLKGTKLVNASSGGRSNANIFADTVKCLLTLEDVEYVFVAWTSWPRYELLLGIETYNTRQLVSPGCPMIDHNINGVTYSAAYLTKIRDRFTSLDHPHNEIVNLIGYTNTLIKLSKLKDVKLFFVNALCLWDSNYFTKLENRTPADFTAYTRTLLSTDNRDDDEIFKLYNRLHSDYENAGSIQSDHWLNLYNSLRSNQIDVNDDCVHPGYESNKIFSDLLNSSLNQRLSQQ